MSFNNNNILLATVPTGEAAGLGHHFPLSTLGELTAKHTTILGKALQSLDCGTLQDDTLSGIAAHTEG